MSSLKKMLGILDLFDEGQTGVRLDDVVALTGGSRATAYRYLQSLTEAGMLAPAMGGAYVLGPRVIELDRLVRMTDPLLTGAQGVLRDIAGRTGVNAMLCSYYGDKVMCVDLVWPDTSVEQAYERGRPMPMFRGAMAKTILANLTTYRLRQIMTRHADEIRAAGLGESWTAFRTAMARLRKAPVVVTRGEVVPGLVGVGAALFDSDGRVLGSLVLAVPDARYDRDGPDVYREQVTEAARRITQATALAGQNPVRAAMRPARPRRGRPPKVDSTLGPALPIDASHTS